MQAAERTGCFQSAGRSLPARSLTSPGSNQERSPSPYLAAVLRLRQLLHTSAIFALNAASRLGASFERPKTMLYLPVMVEYFGSKGWLIGIAWMSQSGFCEIVYCTSGGSAKSASMRPASMSRMAASLVSYSLSSVLGMALSWSIQPKPWIVAIVLPSRSLSVLQLFDFFCVILAPP